MILDASEASGASGSLCEPLGTFGSFWSYWDCVGTLEAFEPSWEPLERLTASGGLWGRMASRNLWDPRSLWELLGASGSILTSCESLVASRNLWKLLEPLAAFGASRRSSRNFRSSQTLQRLPCSQSIAMISFHDGMHANFDMIFQASNIYPFFSYIVQMHFNIR